jgi:hypothetical protein|tara:strand:- start:587 stop:808 length:222 start_codon:yes stop_codon:yes gene_type:complete
MTQKEIKKIQDTEIRLCQILNRDFKDFGHDNVWTQKSLSSWNAIWELMVQLNIKPRYKEREFLYTGCGIRRLI